MARAVRAQWHQAPCSVAGEPPRWLAVAACRTKLMVGGALAPISVEAVRDNPATPGSRRLRAGSRHGCDRRAPATNPQNHGSRSRTNQRGPFCSSPNPSHRCLQDWQLAIPVDAEVCDELDALPVPRTTGRVAGLRTGGRDCSSRPSSTRSGSRGPVAAAATTRPRRSTRGGGIVVVGARRRAGRSSYGRAGVWSNRPGDA